MWRVKCNRNRNPFFLVVWCVARWNVNGRTMMMLYTDQSINLWQINTSFLYPAIAHVSDLSDLRENERQIKSAVLSSAPRSERYRSCDRGQLWSWFRCGCRRMVGVSAARCASAGVGMGFVGTFGVWGGKDHHDHLQNQQHLDITSSCCWSFDLNLPLLHSIFRLFFLESAGLFTAAPCLSPVGSLVAYICLDVYFERYISFA